MYCIMSHKKLISTLHRENNFFFYVYIDKNSIDEPHSTIQFNKVFVHLPAKLYIYLWIGIDYLLYTLFNDIKCELCKCILYILK